MYALNGVSTIPGRYPSVVPFAPFMGMSAGLHSVHDSICVGIGQICLSLLFLCRVVYTGYCRRGSFNTPNTSLSASFPSPSRPRWRQPHFSDCSASCVSPSRGGRLQISMSRSRLSSTSSSARRGPSGSCRAPLTTRCPTTRTRPLPSSSSPPSRTPRMPRGSCAKQAALTPWSSSIGARSVSCL